MSTSATPATTASTPVATTSSATQGLLSTMGIGSGLNISALVTALTNAEVAPKQTQLTAKSATVATQLSAVGQFQGALSSFETTVTALQSATALHAVSATSSDTTLFTATANAAATTGTYSVQVQQLASAQQLVSGTFAGGGATVVGYGALSIKLGTKAAFTVNVSSTAKTLANIRDAINSAPGNSGVQATLVYSGTTAQLVLNSTQTGAANTISIAASGGDGGLATLAYSAGSPGQYTVNTAAQDSIISIAGVTHQSSSNAVSDAIDGVTLNLVAADRTKFATLTTAQDQNTVITNVKNFVAAYNAMQQTLSGLDSYSAASNTAGPLLGDSMLETPLRRLIAITTGAVSGLGGPYTSLASLGVTTDPTTGQLSLDTTKLTAALQASPTAASSLFNSTQGIATRLNHYLTSVLGPGGAVEARNKTLADQQKQIQSQTLALNLHMADVQAGYTAQFTALDSLMSQLNSTANYLTQAFDSINGTNSSSSSKSG